jgi:hypothetical protein
VRVNADTAVPYWVDHVNKAASAVPPVPPPGFKPPPPQTGVTCTHRASAAYSLAYYHVEALPEYQIYTAKLTRAVDAVDKLNGAFNRHRARVEAATSGTHGGHGSSGHGGGGGGGGGNVRAAIESSVIDDAHVVFTTLNRCRRRPGLYSVLILSSVLLVVAAGPDCTLVPRITLTCPLFHGFFFLSAATWPSPYTAAPGTRAWKARPSW